jgi:hypothetical protein
MIGLFCVVHALVLYAERPRIEGIAMINAKFVLRVWSMDAPLHKTQHEIQKSMLKYTTLEDSDSLKCLSLCMQNDVISLALLERIACPRDDKIVLWDVASKPGHAHMSTYFTKMLLQHDNVYILF